MIDFGALALANLRRRDALAAEHAGLVIPMQIKSAERALAQMQAAGDEATAQRLRDMLAELREGRRLAEGLGSP